MWAVHLWRMQGKFEQIYHWRYLCNLLPTERYLFFCLDIHIQVCVSSHSQVFCILSNVQWWEICCLSHLLISNCFSWLEPCRDIWFKAAKSGGRLVFFKWWQHKPDLMYQLVLSELSYWLVERSTELVFHLKVCAIWRKILGLVIKQ